MSDTVRIICPNLNCRAILSVPDTARGRVVKCKRCATKVMIPQKKAPAPVPDDGGEEEQVA